MKFKAQSTFPKELVYPLLLVLLVVEIVLIVTSSIGQTPWTFIFIPFCLVIPFCTWFWAIAKGSYYLVTQNRLSIYSGFVLSERVFINSIYKIDQDTESFAQVYRATFIEMGRTSLKLRLKNGKKRIVVGPINQEKFISELLKYNPKIEVDLKYK